MKILKFFLAIGCLYACLIITDFAEASDHSCNTFSIISQIAKKSILTIDDLTRSELKKYSFDDVDPLEKFDGIEPIARKGVAEARRILLRCDPADSIYLALFSDPSWGARAVIAAMSQAARNERASLEAPFVGYIIATLNERSVPEVPSGTCGPHYAPRSSEISPGNESAWYRRRILMWVKCSDGKTMAYLPEIGWAIADDAQKAAIKEFNPDYD